MANCMSCTDGVLSTSDSLRNPEKKQGLLLPVFIGDPGGQPFPNPSQLEVLIPPARKDPDGGLGLGDLCLGARGGEVQPSGPLSKRGPVVTRPNDSAVQQDRASAMEE